MRMLGTGRRVFKIDEPGIGVHLGVTISGMTGLRPINVPSEGSRVSDFRGDAPDYFFSKPYEATWRPLLRDLILGRIAAQIEKSAQRSSRPIVVIKEPHGSLAADLLMSTLPESRLIFLLRDGRDVVDSDLDAATSDEWGGAELEGFETKLIDRSAFIRYRAHAWLWNVDSVNRAFLEHPPDRRVLVRYEDLRANTDAVFAELCRSLGLGLTSQEIQDAVERFAFERIPAVQRGPGQFARAATPGLWRTNLSPQEQELLADLIGDRLHELGYESAVA